MPRTVGTHLGIPRTVKHGPTLQRKRVWSLLKAMSVLTPLSTAVRVSYCETFGASGHRKREKATCVLQEPGSRWGDTGSHHLPAGLQRPGQHQGSSRAPGTGATATPTGRALLRTRLTEGRLSADSA